MVIEQASNNQVLNMGDFNYSKINWENLEVHNKEREFADLVQDCFLDKHVLAPTRGNNVLDFILSSEVGMV